MEQIPKTMELENGSLSLVQIEKLRIEIEELEEQRESRVEKLRLEVEELRLKNKWANRAAQYIPLITVLVTVAGFCFGVFQFRSQQKENLNRVAQEREAEIGRQKRQAIEKQLKEFYYPVAMRLKIDDVLWSKLKEMQDDKLRANIEKQEVLPNQAEILRIIFANPDVMLNDKTLREQVEKFIKHAIIQRSLRAMGQYDRDAISESEKWPADFEPTIDKQAALLQARFDICVRSPAQCN